MTRQPETKASMAAACKKIAPVWSLENYVAVNPFLDFANKTMAETAAELYSLSDISLTMPLSYYTQKVHEGKITHENIAHVLRRYGIQKSPGQFITQIENEPEDQRNRIRSYSELAKLHTHNNWPLFIAGRITAWASTHFDKGQSTWKSGENVRNIFKSWKSETLLDLSPEIAGLKGFRKKVCEIPDDYTLAMEWALDILDISDDPSLENYFHLRLRNCGGWAAYAAYLDWEDRLNGNNGEHLHEFLTIMVCWDALVCLCLSNPILQEQWEKQRKSEAWNSEFTLSDSQRSLLILQESLELAVQKEITQHLSRVKAVPNATKRTPRAQAVFCIDVRSEILRRNLEIADPLIETLGFAGFFGFPVGVKALGGDHVSAQCPVLLKPVATVIEAAEKENQTETLINKRLFTRQVKHIWTRFKTGAITCFGFVSPLGISFLPGIIKRSFKRGINKNKVPQMNNISLMPLKSDPAITGIALNEKVKMAINALKGMSLGTTFSPIVLIVGHGSESANNPHASGLDCGACGGHSGEANAKIAANIFNDPDVRFELIKEGIVIPSDTVFVPCLHNTTTDEVTILEHPSNPGTNQIEFLKVVKALEIAGKLSRSERMLRMADIKKSEQAIFKRRNDWSQVRPEWGLAGCSFFIVGQRDLTRSINLGGRSFLHSYDWTKDKDGSILELIMTAPMIVTSWINLQYYASTTDNAHFGAGNKTLHNVTSGIGVIEGYSGDLRTGLPWQSIHDGVEFQHEPVRLNVALQAPIETINNILENHESVKNLCDNHWIHLFKMSDDGKITDQYLKGLEWQSI